MEEAERIARDEHGSRKLAIISGSSEPPNRTLTHPQVLGEQRQV